jgi:hypothetical protein
MKEFAAPVAYIRRSNQEGIANRATNMGRDWHVQPAEVER